MRSTIVSSTRKYPSSSPRFPPPRIWPSPSGTVWRPSSTLPSCIAYGSTKRPTCSSMSTEKHEDEQHESAPDPPLHVFGVAPFAQRPDDRGRKPRNLRQVQ